MSMKNIASGLIALTFLASTISGWAQDPKFRDAEARRAAPTNATAPQDDSNAAAARINSMEQLDDSIQLRVGDKVSLRIVEDRDKTLSLLVQASGDIQAPHLGLVRAAGLTCKKVAYYMKRELERSYFQQATVIVALESRQQSPAQASNYMEYFTIFGQVARQGKYEMIPDEELTVSQAILRAGGFSQFAKTSKVKVIRRVPGKKNAEIQVDCDKIMRKGKLELDIPIRPNDVIIVDERIFNF